MTDTACFVLEDGQYRPLDPARSYWSRDALGGRAVVGLIGHEIERRHGAPFLIPARLTVDMFSLAPFGMLQIQSRVLKDGKRLRLVEAELVGGGETVARATCQFLAPAPAPSGKIWSPAPWMTAHPDTLENGGRKESPRAFDLRWAAGRLGAVTEKACWIRERFALVEGQPLSPFSRVAIAADFVSPFTNAGDEGIGYMNTDVSIQLHRLPVGSWIGFEATGHDASQGIAVGHSRLYDLHGPIGFAGCTALANRRRSERP